MSDANPSAKTGPLYLDDLHVGQRFVGGSQRVEADAIKQFARQFDPQPFHLGEEGGRQSMFGGLVASGWHTGAISMRLMVEAVPIAGGLIGASGEIRWTKPVRPGDTLHVESEIVEVRPSRSHPERGLVAVRSETRNQAGELVEILVAHLVVPRRPA
jgi:acyl dehydratase